MDRLDTLWEVGSEFHWSGLPQSPFLPWPEPHVMFASGRAAFLSVWRLLSKSTSNYLFVPDYFCDEVVGWWEKKGVPTKRYADGPHRETPDWETLAVSPGDVVLAVNYFGVRDGRMWEPWRRAHDKVVLVEDHSHDPLSGWARNSAAEYAFASLRKTFPVPDGSIAWSPRSRPLPELPSSDDWRGSALKLAAMVLKREYLAGGGEKVKRTFRDFQLEGERLIRESKDAAVSPWSDFLLSSGYPVAWRERREQNVRAFFDSVGAHPSVRPLFTDWPGNHCPYNAVLLFPSRTAREEGRLRLIEAHVYPSVHWELNPDSSPDSLDVSGRILTIPTDQRYSAEDLKRVALILLDGLRHG